MWFSILAVQALTLLSALHAGSIAVTVVLFALTFFTSAPPERYPGRNSFESSRMSKVGHLLGPMDLIATLNLVATSHTLAFLVANLSFREAFTIHFKAVNLAALTSLKIVGVSSGRKVKFIDHSIRIRAFIVILF